MKEKDRKDVKYSGNNVKVVSTIGHITFLVIAPRYTKKPVVAVMSKACRQRLLVAILERKGYK